MTKRVFLLYMVLSFSTVSFSQFISVKNGDWRDPLTWSTNPLSTALPDSTTDVIIQHTVTVSSLYADCRCKNMYVMEGATLANYSTSWVSSNLIVEKDFINRGTLLATHDYFNLTVRGNFINYGTVTRSSTADYFHLSLWGNIQNHHSFRGIHNTTFVGGTGHNIHYIKSVGDSTLFLGDAFLSDSLGSIVVDSAAIIHSYTFNLKQGKLVIPPSTTWENKLTFDGGSIKNGTIVANRNTIYTKSVGSVGLSNYTSPENHLYIQNSVLAGNFIIGGDFNTKCVVLQGENKLTGRIADWYSASMYSGGDRSIKIEGKFTNQGIMCNTTESNMGWGLWIIQMPGSSFINLSDSLKINGQKFEGACSFTSFRDTLVTPLWVGNDTNTYVTLFSNPCFTKTTTIDMKGGTLSLKPQGSFKTLYGSGNVIRNTRVKANGAEIYLPCTYENTQYNDPNFKLTYFRYESVLTGQIHVKGALAPYYNYATTVKVNGDITNKGSIVNHPNSGTLYLEATRNILHDGITWSNAMTKINGLYNQNIILPNDSIIKGAFLFESMLSGSKFQWKKNGVNLSNATSAQLSFNNGINKTHYGLYQCFANDTVPSRTIFIGKEVPAAYKIFDVQIKNIGVRTTKITWKTTVPTKGFVFFVDNDPANGYPFEAMEPDSLVTSHQIVLDSLKRGVTYYFLIDQNDKDWNNIRSQEFSFIAGDMAVGAVKINKIWDVPLDQGRWVYVHFDADLLDASGEVRNYGIWEWMDGGWTSLGTVQATQNPTYTFLARTNADSTANGLNWSRFKITAHTTKPIEFYTSPPDSGYSVDNLIPSIPTGLHAVLSNNSVELTWDSNSDPDVQYYSLYRDGLLYQTIKENRFTDVNLTSSDPQHSYQLTAVDFNGNESQKTTNVVVILTSLKNISTESSLCLRNEPNPFTHFTTIHFFLEKSTKVELCVLDLTGKLIECLLDEVCVVGNHDITYRSKKLSPGIYLYRLKTNESTVTKKMILR